MLESEFSESPVDYTPISDFHHDQVIMEEGLYIGEDQITKIPNGDVFADYHSVPDVVLSESAEHFIAEIEDQLRESVGRTIQERLGE